MYPNPHQHAAMICDEMNTYRMGQLDQREHMRKTKIKKKYEMRLVK